ncbi:hypothetical protein [Nocardia sp. NPDC020380]|uniref:hypothetical protein n=1 Tax=Nocardia sp. NPDC020380 TaxID=3364309 RepID=UPI0037A4908C
MRPKRTVIHRISWLPVVIGSGALLSGCYDLTLAAIGPDSVEAACSGTGELLLALICSQWAVLSISRSAR